MKSHPDAASRLAAEVVTQLPVPSRLGMLRYERLNEASWSLLFLDPACERQLGIPAADLCALVDAPYASLMEPEARYRLHDTIQAQLAQQGHYLIHYTLHTPRGPLTLMELGEPFKQRGRHLLRGYLMIADSSLLSNGDQRASELQAHNQRLQTSLALYQRDQAAFQQQQDRTRVQQDLIVTLARHRYRAENPLREAAELITKVASEIYAVARAGIWNLNGETLEPMALYDGQIAQYLHPQPLSISRFPAYLQALQGGRALDAHDALQDPRTAELAVDYLCPLGITAVLDASIRVGGEVVAVLCLEHTGTARTWQADEVAFAGELADQYAQVLTNYQRRSATSALYLFQRAVEQSASAFILLDRDGLVEYVNPSFTAITLYSAEEVQGRLLSELPALENLSDLLFDAQSGLAEHHSWQGEFKSRRKNLEPYWSQLSISKVHADDGTLTHYIGIYEDITESKQSQQRIERLAYSDNLTGLGNRYAFIRALEARFAESATATISLLLVDIDNFKRINDSLGHQTGDKLLVSLAKRLRNSLSPHGVLARFASNEFAILLTCDLEDSQAIAQQVLQTLDKPLFIDNQLISVTGSVGLACAPLHGDDPQTLMKHAGLALHKAKANGKHQMQVFTEALNAEADYKLFVENNLRRALTQNELEVFYQPKLCLKTGQLIGMEALLRWQHPERGMIRPDQFIGVAEETGLIIPIGKWVVRQACRMSMQLTAVGLVNLQVAINLSPKQFSDPDLVGSITTILQEEQMPTRLLELELTESLLLDATEDTRQQLASLKALGLTLAMDDFGTGYSSLSYLKKFPIDVIKIDRSFIKDIPDNQDDMEITSAVVAMAHNLKLKVVAEGIETAAQLAFLRRQQCDIGQGYLFDQPIPGRDLLERLKRYPRRPPA
ncbi:MAG: EAL domain-containing protein [Gammaproteobacteria bacterium]|nr:EAL domain-containing protein [Gammaproteobacteria bacterium]MBU1489341.1 EAL domain-containing protein [Gammaproteobacteria bacterium]MBU2065121.1 EAL domain-containing protein [Gammaproteobacteria bacterium]MBU2137253.1 EAL domain-containing protein [Gammaproteobacteria bacterium]MBU2217956.1 EAL domain-containing protein [Gammaproteobacteria bacterium]